MGLVQTEPEGTGLDTEEKERPAAAQSSGSLTRITANFTPRAAQALEAIAAKTGDSKTDILNRAVMVLEVVVEALERGNGKVKVVNPDGTQEVWRLVG